MTIKQMASIALMIWNMIVFITYGIDKGKARKSTYRISEKTLLFMSYLGGGLGAWAGGTHFRHKTQKKYFQLSWAVGLMVDAVIMYWIWK